MNPPRPDRLDGATGWIVEALLAVGLAPIGGPELVRDRPWSTQLRVLTTAGPAWFKANCPAFAFEGALHARLAELLPDHVDAPIAVDAGRGWLLTADRGPTLAATRTPTCADWRGILAAAARMQRRLAGHSADVLATGLPQRRPEGLPDRFAEAVEALAGLPAGHPSRLEAGQARALTAAAPAVSRACRILVDSPLPVSLQHGDLHPGNVFATPDGLRLFDFGDAQWATATELLCVPQAVVEHAAAEGGEATDPPTWVALVEAYRQVWVDEGVPLGRDRLEALVAASTLSHAVHRCGTWRDALAEGTPEEIAEWGEAPRRHLLTVLQPVGNLGG